MYKPYEYEVPKEFSALVIVLLVAWFIAAVLIVRILIRHKETNESLYLEGLVKAIRTKTGHIKSIRGLRVLLCVEYTLPNYEYLHKMLSTGESGYHIFTAPRTPNNLYLLEFYDQHGHYCKALAYEHKESVFRPKVLQLYQYGTLPPFSIRTEQAPNPN
jgi:hypothetical protein